MANGQSLNRYAFVNGNPISSIDPFGLCAEFQITGNGYAFKPIGNDNKPRDANGNLIISLVSIQNIEDLPGALAVSPAGPVESTAITVGEEAPILIGDGASIVDKAIDAARNTNPFMGPITEDIIIVDPAGNAMPLEAGQQIQGRPDSKMWQVKDEFGNPTGERYDGMGHPKQADPAAREPHGHRIDADGNQILGDSENPHLPAFNPNW